VKQLSPRIALLAILSLFVLPLLLAWLMYTDKIDIEPRTTQNRGQLVAPVAPVDWSAIPPPDSNTEGGASLAGHWVVVYLLPDPCAESCIQQVTGLRQVHRASGRHENRIIMVLLSPAGVDQSTRDRLLAIYPRFVVLGPVTGEVLTAMAQADQRTAGSAALYLADPLGNIMMTYPGPDNLNALNTDLKQLLTWSKQDQQP